MSIVINILLVIEVLICLLLILLVLMQRPKNEGLGAAFGGGMTENLFGAQTTNVLQTMTRNLGITFFIVSGVLGWLSIRNNAGKTSIQKELSSVSALVATPAPATPPVGVPPLPVEAPAGEKEPKSPTPLPLEKPASETGNQQPKPETPPAKSDSKPGEPGPAPAPDSPKPPEPPKQ
jgi:preprotein translocase subunit SecG